MYLTVKENKLKRLNQKDVLICLKGKTATAKKSQIQIESILNCEFKTIVKNILGNLDVFYYTSEGKHIGSISKSSGSLYFYTYSEFIDIKEEREITSSTYKRSVNNVAKNFNNYFRKN